MLTANSFTEMHAILNSFLDKKLSNRIIRNVIRLSMDALFTEQELENLRKQVEMDKERFYRKKGLEEGLAEGLEQ